MEQKKKVLVGMSGGVDSSVSAALLIEQGYDVTGGFIKNWSDSKDLWTGECQWRGERRDALRVAAKLGIPLLTFDFESAYRERVVNDLFRGYEAGETPNPDVLCNEAIKFGLFFEEAMRLGFDYIAMGHYARVERDGNSAKLLRGLDSDKDQSYFLYRVSQNVLRRTLLPIGEFKKADVREKARAFDLPVADKPDSQGICFIGKLDMAEFLRKKIPSKPGEIVDPEGNVLGQHEGLDAYTIGQRQGIKISEGGHAWYVAKKDLDANRLVIVPNDEHPLLYASELTLHDLHWTRGEALSVPFDLEVQARYRQVPVKATLERFEDGIVYLQLKEPIKAAAAGQSAVLYLGEECLGGGIIR
ncbi:MAG: tRNA 2-thiouridine(34) synthase MnmA [Patescibacteria group bacterium]|jgi:tRNA-specific 2-thiouridylase